MENDNKVEIGLITASLLKANEAEFRPGFVAWATENWNLYKAFENEALHIAQSGRKHYSARTISEYLRHETTHRDENSAFKINDHITPDLARLFALRNPLYSNLFAYRASPTRPAPKLAHLNANMHEMAAA